MKNLLWIVLAAIVLGVGYFVYSGQSVTEAVDSVTETVTEVAPVEAVTEAAEGVAEAVEGAVDAATETATEAAAAVTEAAEATADAATGLGNAKLTASFSKCTEKSKVPLLTFRSGKAVRTILLCVSSGSRSKVHCPRGSFSLPKS